MDLTPEDQLQEFLAKRVLARSEGKDLGGTDDARPTETQGPLAEIPPDFAKVEKNLASIGFFTPSKKKIKDLKKKRISFARMIDGRRVEVSATILPSAEYGLPTTSDQDKYLAFMKLVNETKLREGVVRNPVGFTSRQLLYLLGIESAGGKVYDEIVDWMRRMTLTGITSEGVVYFAGRKTWATDTFHVFTRAVATGWEMPDGAKADRHYVWLSEWQLENINSAFLIPVDLESYRQLRNHIAKALVPLLQIWLYASRRDGVFEKRYEELCEILSIRSYTAISRINEQLGPSLDELTARGYLSRWIVERTVDLSGFKVLLSHGDKFYREHQLRQRNATLGLPTFSHEESSNQPGTGLPQAGPAAFSDSPPDSLLAELLRRGIHRGQARKLVATISPDQEVMDQLEWGDHLVAESKQGRGQPFRNPPGFYIHLVSNNINPPDNFMTSRRRRLHQEAREAQAREEVERGRRHEAYYQYKRRAVRKHVEESYSPDEYERLVSKEIADLAREDPARMEGWVPRTQRIYAESRIRSRIEQDLPFLTFSEFCEQENQNLSLPFEEASQESSEFTE